MSDAKKAAPRKKATPLPKPKKVTAKAVVKMADRSKLKPVSTVEELRKQIEKSEKAGEFIPWAGAWDMIRDFYEIADQYRPAYTGYIVEAWETAKPGSSAILVSSKGTWGENAPESHEEYLKEAGYDQVPKRS